MSTVTLDIPPYVALRPDIAQWLQDTSDSFYVAELSNDEARAAGFKVRRGRYLLVNEEVRAKWTVIDNNLVVGETIVAYGDQAPSLHDDAWTTRVITRSSCGEVALASVVWRNVEIEVDGDIIEIALSDHGEWIGLSDVEGLVDIQRFTLFLDEDRTYRVADESKSEFVAHMFLSDDSLIVNVDDVAESRQYSGLFMMH